MGTEIDSNGAPILDRWLGTAHPDKASQAERCYSEALNLLNARGISGLAERETKSQQLVHQYTTKEPNPDFRYRMLENIDRSGEGEHPPHRWDLHADIALPSRATKLLSELNALGFSRLMGRSEDGDGYYISITAQFEELDLGKEIQEQLQALLDEHLPVGTKITFYFELLNDIEICRPSESIQLLPMTSSLKQ